MVQIMQRLLEGVQGELQAEERDLCAHLNAHAHLLLLEAHLEGLGSGLDCIATPDSNSSKGKGKQLAATPGSSPDEAAAASDDGTGRGRGKRPLTPGKLVAFSPSAACVACEVISVAVVASVIKCVSRQCACSKCVQYLVYLLCIAHC